MKKSHSGVPQHPDRFVGMATLALQHPDLAADQLDEAVRKLGMRGAAIGGSVEGQELSDRKFDPFWAKAEELGVVLFMHPQPGAPARRRTLGCRERAAWATRSAIRWKPPYFSPT